MAKRSALFRQHAFTFPAPMVLLWGAEGRMLYNDAYSAFAGGRHPSLLGSKVREGWPEVAAFNDNVMRVGLAGGTLSYESQELTLLREDFAEQVWMDLNYSPVADELGLPCGVLCVLAETTKRILAERERATAEANLGAERDLARQVLEGMGEGYILLDRNFQVLDINRQGAQIDGRTRDDVVGRSHWDIWPGTRDSELGATYERGMRERTSVSVESQYKWLDGRVAWMDVRGYPLGDGLALFYRDVTSRKLGDAYQKYVFELSDKIRELADPA